jgi:hypothetical protein
MENAGRSLDKLRFVSSILIYLLEPIAKLSPS